MNPPQGHRAALALVARRFGLDGRVIAPLGGGSRNHVYRLGRPPQAVAVRIAGAGDARLGVLRASELLAQRAAAAAGLAPRVLWSGRESGILVSEFVEGRVWSAADAATPRSIRRVAAWLRRLHALAPPAGLHGVDFLGSLRGYCGRLPPGSEVATLLGPAVEWRAQLGQPARVVVCHHDLHHANVLEAGDGLRVVDWEYAGLGDPVMDLAGFASYHALDEAGARLLVEAYGEPGAVTAARLAPARRLFEAVTRAWSEVGPA